MIDVQFDDGAERATVRLVPRLPSDQALLSELFLKLSSGALARFDAAASGHFTLDGPVAFVWRVMSRRKLPSLTVTNLGLEWSLTTEEWEHCADLMAGLMDGGHGHQYLSTDEAGEVVVSVNEDR